MWPCRPNRCACILYSAEGIFWPRVGKIHLIPFFIHRWGWGGVQARGQGVQWPWHAAVSWGTRRSSGHARAEASSGRTGQCREPGILAEVAAGLGKRASGKNQRAPLT
jgi:hypothetical protein